MIPLLKSKIYKCQKNSKKNYRYLQDVCLHEFSELNSKYTQRKKKKTNCYVNAHRAVEMRAAAMLSWVRRCGRGLKSGVFNVLLCL